MAAITYYKTKDSVVTIGSIAEESRIISDITVGGAEKEEVDIDAIDGIVYSFGGTANKATIEFDFLQGTTYNIVEMVYGPESTAGSPVTHTLSWGGDGVAKTITITNVRSTTGQTLTVTMTEVEGISAPITYVKGQAVTRHFKGVTGAQNITETNLVSS